MKDLKHTPGQWAVKKWLDGNIDIVIHINEKRMTGIAQINALKSEEETEANTRLIAAAPELLEALKELVDVDEFDHVACFKAQIKAKAAIEKATLNP